MSFVDESNISCGVAQLVELYGSSRSHVVTVADDLLDKGGISQLVFSDNIGNRNGARLAAYIKRRPKLGEIVESRRVKNRNSGNTICTWIWTLPDGKAEEVANQLRTAVGLKMIKRDQDDRQSHSNLW